MVFKLVRCDAIEPCKIQLPVGTHTIGRGKFLECGDKRVSRNHGELEVTEDSVTIKSLHQNPCFYIKKGSSETNILRNTFSASLTNGDRFGLLPDSHWYELLLCNIPDVTNQPNNQERVNESNDTDKNIDEAFSDRTIFNFENNTEQFDEKLYDNLNDEAVEGLDSALIKDSEKDRSDSPSLLAPENQTTTQEYQVADQQALESTSPIKRGHDAGDSDKGTKKIKVEPDVKSDPEIKKESDIKNEPEDEAAGPSSNQNWNTNDKDKDAPSKPANNGPIRERCMYGANCYRRNPQHKAQFSHPSDVDWGTGERGQCPWGAACSRRDPRHWRDHDHPPGVHPPPHRPGGTRIQKREKKRKTPDQSPESNLIVTGKRARKTIKRPSWSGSESENEYDMDDPFLTDGSDEWEPPSDINDSQDCTPDTLEF